MLTIHFKFNGMKKSIILIFLLTGSYVGYTQNVWKEYTKINFALRGMSNRQVPHKDTVEQSMFVTLKISRKTQKVFDAKFYGSIPKPIRNGECLCLEEEMPNLFNLANINWDLFNVEMYCDTSVIHIPIIFRNETVPSIIPKGFSFYRDCSEYFFASAPVIGGCSSLLKPIIVYWESEPIEN